MAKDGASAKLITPLYGAGGTTNGTAAGPKGGVSIPGSDKLTRTGMAAPGGGKK